MNHGVEEKEERAGNARGAAKEYLVKACLSYIIERGETTMQCASSASKGEEDLHCEPDRRETAHIAREK